MYDPREIYLHAIEFASNDATSNEMIFKLAKGTGRDDTNVLLGILNGVIMRDSPNLVSGILKQFVFNTDDLLLSAEHAEAMSIITGTNYAPLIRRYYY
jgi:hypothetical protein